MRPRPLLAALAALTLASCSSDLAEPSSTAVTAPADTSRPPATEPAATEPAATEPAATEPATTELGTGEPDAFADAAAATDELFADLAADEPGCTWAVGIDGEVVHAGAAGAASIEDGTPMDTSTVVDIGSTSKQFTATAILLLAISGELDPTLPIDTYLTGLPDWAAEVTTQQLAHHVSGIPDYVGLLLDAGFDYADVTTDADTLAVLGEVAELDFEPGDHFEYSNSNYFLMGQIVLAVTGVDLGTYLATEVFEPLDLGMVMDPTADIADKATSYEWDDTDETWIVADNPWEQIGDGGIQTTPSELVRWAAEYWAPTIGGADLNDARIGDTVEAEAGVGYGWGIGILDVGGLGTVLSHSGGWGGFVTSFDVLPDDRLAVSVTCTAYELDVAQRDIGIEIAQLWHDALDV